MGYEDFINERIFNWIPRSPTYKHLNEWLNQYSTIIFYSIKKGASAPLALESQNIDEFKYSVENYREMYFKRKLIITRKLNLSEVESLTKLLESTSNHNLALLRFLEKKCILYTNKLSVINGGQLLDILLDVNELRHLRKGTLNFFEGSSDDREFSEGDFWSGVYEHQKEYNDNH